MEWIANEYDNFQKHFQLQYGLDLLSTLESTVSLENKSILDLGCGTGDLTLCLKKKTAPTGHVTALDRDPNMLSTFRRKPGSEQINLISGNLTDWPLSPTYQCDVVFSNAALHWLRSYDELNTVFKNSRRCLTQPGHFAFRFSLNSNLEKLKDFLEDALRDFCARPDLHLWRSIFDFNHCLRHLKKNNFAVSHAEIVSYTPFTDDEMGFRWMMESQPILAYLKSDQLESFHKFLRARWQEAPVAMECYQGIFVGSTC